MERYEAYKDSGVEWIGKIPSTWQMLRIQQCFAEERRINDGLESFHALKFSAGSIVPKPEKWDEDEIADTYARYRCVNPGTIMINNLNLNFDLKSLRVGLVEEEGIITSAYIAIVPGAEIEPRFANYVLKGWDYRKAFHNMGKGLRLTLDWHELSKYRIQTPCRIEQQVIADYLDAKTAEIDALVADCEREVGLLQEYRKAVISEAVTKGLDPDAPMKDSGIEWIGEIPVNWNMMQLGKLCARIFDGPFGSNLKSNDYVDEGIRVVRLENLKYLQFDATKESFVTPEKYESIKQHTVYPEDLIVATFIIDSVKACRLPKDIEFAVNKADCLGVRTGDDIEADFLKYYLSSCQVFDYLVALTHGSTRQRINTTQLKTLLTLLPPIRIQQEIVAHLDGLCAEIDSLIDAKQSMADKFREYRRSLISEAVTGKFKVPGVE